MAIPSNQQKLILQTMGAISGYTDFKTLATKAGITKDSFRSQLAKMEKNGWVKCEAEGSTKWAISDDGMNLVNEGKAEITREDVGLNESQIFAEFGRSVGGILPERLVVISQVIFNDDAYNLDKVWLYLGRMNVPIDIRRSWWTCWDSYLRNINKPVSISDETKAAVTLPAERTEDQKKEAEKQQLDYDVETNPNTGLADVVKIGPGIGQLTMEEASKIVGLKNQQIRALAMANPPQAPQEPLSQLLTAMAPYLKKDADESTLRELITLQFGNMTKAITDTMPKAGQQTPVDQISTLLSSLKDLGPALRPLLGIPEPGAGQPQDRSTPLQVMDQDGKPMVLNIGDLLTIKKFDAEQKREDDSAKGKQDFMKEVRGFISTISKAMERAAQNQ